MRIVIFGANDIGYLIATEFFEDHDITLIGTEENKVEDLRKLDISFVTGNASNINVLKAAQIETADIFIACADLDEANIVSCITAKKISDVRAVCFVSKPEFIESLAAVKDSDYEPGFFPDYLIWPEELLTQEIYRIITVPEAIDVENFAQGRARLLEYRIKENSKFLNHKIKDCTFPEDLLIVGITRDSKLFIPDGDTVLSLYDKVIFIGSAISLDTLAGRYFRESGKIQNVTIIGGGNVGLMLAEHLEKVGIKAKIIEKNYKRCEQLCETLKKTLVLNGDGTNLELLEQEEIGESDVVVSVTNNDEKNLLCSLLSKQLGVAKVIARVSKNSNVGLFEKVGIDVALSPMEAAINELRNRFIDADSDLLAVVERGQGEVLELITPERFNNLRLMDLKLPEKAIISIVQRGNKVIIPKGQTLLRVNDYLTIFTTEENSPKIKEFFKR